MVKIERKTIGTLLWILPLIYTQQACRSSLEIDGDQVTQDLQFAVKDPDDFSVATITDTSVTLAWVDRANDETSYELQMCSGVDCTEFSEVSQSPISEDSETHGETGLAPNSTYRFRIRVVRPSGRGKWVNSSNITTLGTPSSSFTVTSTGTTSVSFSWTDQANGEPGYEVQLCSGPECTNFSPVSASPLAADANSHSEAGLTSGATYRFRVRPVSTNEDTVWLTSSDITTLTVAAEAPTGLALSEGTDTSLTIGWTDVATNEFVYEIQRCAGVSCSEFSTVSGSPVAANSNSLTDAGLTANTIYRYRVRATTSSGESSEWTISSDFTTGPSAPSSLTTSGITDAAITIGWTDNDAGNETYQVQKCSGSSCTNFSDVSVSPLAANSIIHTESSLSGNMVYRFRVRALSGSATSAWLTTNDVSTLMTVSSCSSPTTVAVDKGLKGNVIATSRGQWSSTQVHPSTEYPAVAYYDGSATGGTLGIKFGYWDGDEFQIESISGDLALAAGSATWVKLAYLNTGVPMVFWTTGSTTVKGAMRSAAIGTAGTWSSAIVDTFAGGATRALEVSVSPSDHVGIIYLTNTTVAGRARFIACPAPCTSLSSFVAMGASDYIQNNAVTAASVQTGVAWCKKSAADDDYIPIVTYMNSTSNAVMYAQCTGTLNSDCLAATGWDGSSIAAVASASAKVYVDPTVVNDPPKVLYRNSTSNLIAAVNANGCGTAMGAWTLSGAIGSTTTGTSWSSLMKDSSGKFHVVANVSTTSVVYYNSTSTSITGTWNAVGTLETVTLPAVGAGGGSSAIAPTDGKIYSSYGRNAAPYHLLMNVIHDVTVSSSSATVHQMIPDTSGNIGLSLTAGGVKRNVSLATTSGGKPAVAYIDHSIGAAAGAKLKYIQRSGTASTDSWGEPRDLYFPGTPSAPSLAFDHQDLPWISFYDNTNFQFYLATNNISDGSGAWNYYQFPVNGKTAAAVAPAMDDTSVAMYYSSGVAHPVMFVMNSTAAGGAGVKAARFNRTTGTFGSTVATVQGLGATWGTRMVTDFDTSGNIVVAFYDLTAARVKFNLSNDGGVAWEGTSTDLPYTTATTSGREGLSIKLNPYTGKPAVSYYDRLNNKLGYVACSSTLANCTASGNWSATDVDTGAGVSGVTITTLEQILNTSLSFGSTGVPIISYVRGMGAAVPGLYLANYATGSFVSSALVGNANANLTNNGASVAAVNYANSGWSVSSARSSLGHLYNAYIGPNNWLYVTSCGD